MNKRAAGVWAGSMSVVDNHRVPKSRKEAGILRVSLRLLVGDMGSSTSFLNLEVFRINSFEVLK